ncbi:MAG: lysine--tRNA ligase [Phycisphaerales bacterium]|nr:lysine--tRNA ligase [Phycisphaerales bacterium]
MSQTHEVNPGAPGEAESPHRLEQQRRENRSAIAAMGVDPYGGRTEGVISIAEARARFDPEADAAHNAAGKAPPPGYADRRPVATVAGRVVLKRDGGKLVWMQLRDHTSGPQAEGEAAPPQGLVKDLQIAVSKADCAGPGFELAKYLDLGDVVVARGPLMRTKTGEITVWASSLTMAAKSLAPPPEKFKGLSDVEIRYRKRYMDLYANPEGMAVFMLRARLASVIRAFLERRGFVEVETPTLQIQAGGAAARPFVTHMNALDIDLFMRVAPELYLKRLLVGGMPRVFEWSRNFRNEGVDRSHNPEFSMIELYEAFGDYGTMRELTESLFRACAGEVASARGAPGDLRLPYGEIVIDFGRPFAAVTYAELFERAIGCSMHDQPAVRAAAEKRRLKLKTDKGVSLDHLLLVQELFDEAEASIDPSVPTFVLDYPAALCPLTRPKASDPRVAERFELFVGGMELANAYTELNDPDVQEAKFREQLAGLDDEEATFRTFDADFVEALKVGMPPAGGLGIGIDRMMMVLLNQRSIRDVILFPLMRPL